MTRLEKYIYKNAKLLGWGTGRVVFALGDVAIKIPYNLTGTKQNRFEYKYYKSMPHKFKSLFPDFLTITQDDIIFTKVYKTYDREDFILPILKQQKFITLENIQLLFQLVIKNTRLDTNEIMHTAGNLGYCEHSKQLKILDFGTPKNSVFLFDNYKTEDDLVKNLYKYNHLTEEEYRGYGY